MKVRMTLLFCLLALIAIPLAYNACSVQGPRAGTLQEGSSAGNPIVEFHVSSYSSTISDLQFCIEELSFDGDGRRVAIPFEDFEVIVHKDGILLGRRVSELGRFRNAQIKLADRCGTGFSLKVTNPNGTVSATDSMTLNFEGELHLDGERRIKLDMQPFAAALESVSTAQDAVGISRSTVSTYLTDNPALPVLVLDEFSFMRRNGLGERVWRPHEYNNQRITLEGGELRIDGGPTAGLGFAFQTYYNGFLFPQAYAQSYVKAGSWQPSVNRLRFSMKCVKPISRNSDGTRNIALNVIHRPHDLADPEEYGSVYEHYFNHNFYSMEPVYIEINRVPQDLSQIGVVYSPSENPTAGRGYDYFDGMTRFNLMTRNQTQWNAQTCYLDNVHFTTELGEPDLLVASITSTYTGSAYEVTWAIPKDFRTQAYEIRYSAQSMKANGFDSGTDGGTVQGGGTRPVANLWTSPAMARVPLFFVAIRPVGSTEFTEIEIPSR